MTIVLLVFVGLFLALLIFKYPPLIAGIVSVAPLWFIDYLLSESVHWAVIGLTFATTSLRQEVADSIVLIKKGIQKKDGK